MHNDLLKHERAQFEFYCNHLEYVDSNINKTLSIFFAFAGLFLFKIDHFILNPGIGSIIVIIIGSVFTATLYRTQKLISDLKYNINRLDQEIKPGIENTIWENYIKPKRQLERTSILGLVSTVLTSLTFATVLIFEFSNQLIFVDNSISTNNSKAIYEDIEVRVTHKKLEELCASKE